MYPAVLPFGSVPAVGRPRWSSVQVVVSRVVDNAPPVRPYPYSVDTSVPDSARGYTWTLATDPLRYEVRVPPTFSRPSARGPRAAIGVVSAAVPCAAPLTYR